MPKTIEMKELIVRETITEDLEALLEIHRLAFQEEDVATLTKNLLLDETAQPLLSLAAFYRERAVGHILFTRAFIKEGTIQNFPVQILAPLAVLPEFQKNGIGRKLVENGLHILKQRGTALVFVLGHPEYYPRFGFINDAIGMGLFAPYPIPEKNRDAWMVQSLNEIPADSYKGQIVCARAMDRPEY